MLDGIAVVSWDVDGTLYEAPAIRGRLRRDVMVSLLRGEIAATARDVVAVARIRRRLENSRRPPEVRDPSSRPSEAAAKVHRETLARRRALEKRWLLPAIAGVGAAPGARDLLAFVRRRVRAQITISDFHAEAKLAALGLSDLFNRSFAAEAEGALKPDPTVFRKALREFRIAPDALLHIGDREDTDGVGARAAGARALVLGRDFDSVASLLQAWRLPVVEGQRRG